MKFGTPRRSTSTAESARDGARGAKGALFFGGVRWCPKKREKKEQHGLVRLISINNKNFYSFCRLH